jgi:hypothetical protein
MRFSYTAIWEDTVRLLRAHASLAVALAGVFLFLPSLLISYLRPMPQTSNPADLLPQLSEYFAGNAHWIILGGILGMAGTLAILMLVFRRPGIAVGAAIVAALSLLPFYFVANLLVSIPVVIGVLLFVVPGLYLLGRLLPIAPVMVAEERRGPVGAIGRTWALTRGHGWAVLGLFLLVFIAGFILTSVAGGLLILILNLALPRDLASFVGLIVSTATSTALQVVLIFLYAAIYRALSARAEAVGSAEVLAAPSGIARTTGTGSGVPVDDNSAV